MKRIKETLNEFIEDNEYVFADPEEGPQNIPSENVELSDEDELEMQDRFESSLKNELNVPEHARELFSFRVKGDSEIIEGIPMARLKDGSFLMKIGDKFKKFKLRDIIEE